MRWVALCALSFLCLVDVRKPLAVQRDVALGCEAFTIWENSAKEPRYYILHCPDDAWGQAEADGQWTEKTP